jgi:hypothetical protein
MCSSRIQHFTVACKQEGWNIFEARKQETVQTAGRPTDSGLQWLAEFSSNLIIYVTKQGSLKCLAQKAEVNQVKHCALVTLAVPTARGSTLRVIKCTLIMIIYDDIILMFAIAELIQNTRMPYGKYRLLLQRLSIATANKDMCKCCCGGTLLVA